MGKFYLVLIALFAIESFTTGIPLNEEENTDNSIGNSLYEGKKWVVLVAGTRGWNKYSNQADICHAYQIVKANGIPKENIITMMVDDIAHNKRNPRQGKIFNQPHTIFRGRDVYKGVEIDYSGPDVTSDNFLSIITGNKTAVQYIGSGKVVEGGPHDTIFINIVTQGGPGILTFPNSYILADELNDVFNTMYANGQYSKILLYIDSDQSGSVFDGILNERLDILAITASGPRESTSSCYYAGFPYYTYYGDTFGVIWMEAVDYIFGSYTSVDVTNFELYNSIRESNQYSNVMIYGDYSVGHEPLSSFIGYQIFEDQSTRSISMKMALSALPSKDVDQYSEEDKLNDSHLTTLKKQELKKELNTNNQMRSIIDYTFKDIYSKVMTETPEIKEIIGEYDSPKNQRLSLDMFPCYRSILNTFSENCFSLTENPYSLERLNVFVNLCFTDNNIYQLVNNVIGESCATIPKNINNVF